MEKRPVTSDMEGQSEFRERIVDVLELIADAEAQIKYQHRVAHVDVASELFNQWDDAYHPKDDEFRRQFESQELHALEVFAELVDVVAAETPQRLPVLTDFINSASWRRLSAGAKLARSLLHGESKREIQNGLERSHWRECCGAAAKSDASTAGAWSLPSV